MRWMSGVACFALCVTRSFAQSPPPLFLEVEAPSQPAPPRTFAAFPVGINFAGLDSNPEALSIQLPGVGAVTAVRSKFSVRTAGGYDWIGKTPAHDVVLSVDGNLITGFIRGGSDTYSLLSDIDGPDVFHTFHHMDSA